MANNSAIGSIFVALGLDTAQFSTGLKKAQSGLGAFGKFAATSLTAAATAAVAVEGALLVAAKGAINYADSIDEASQKTGVAADALSRLAYTAKVEGIGLDGLTSGLGRLSKTMADIASGSGGPAATAFQALGIQVTDASGKLRAADQVFSDIADRFSQLEDGPTKSALAMQIFGKAGADLIPMLNYGADGLRRMSEESDKLGMTVSGATAAAAGDFNDTLTKTGLVLQGVALKAVESAMPALHQFTDYLSSPQVASAAQSFGQVIAAGLGVAVQVVVGLTNAATDLFNYIAEKARAGIAPLAQLSDKEIEDSIAITQKIIDRRKRDGSDLGHLEETQAERRAVLARRKYQDPAGGDVSYSQLSGFGFGTASTPATLNIPSFTDTGAAEAAASRLESLRQSLMSEEELENDSYQKRLDQIKEFYDNRSITQSEYDDLTEKAQKDHADRMTEIAQDQADEENRIRYGLMDVASSIFGSLSTLTENMGEKGLAASKAFGVAEAIVNTAQGITKALAQGGILGFAGAAAVAAAGAAQISTILSTQKGSTGAPSTKGGSVPSATPASVQPDTEGPSQVLNITLQGHSYGIEEIRTIIKGINSVVGNGTVLKVSPA